MLHPRQKAANSTTLPSSVAPQVVIATTPCDGDDKDARPVTRHIVFIESSSTISHYITMTLHERHCVSHPQPFESVFVH